MNATTNAAELATALRAKNGLPAKQPKRLPNSGEIVEVDGRIGVCMEYHKGRCIVYDINGDSFSFISDEERRGPCSKSWRIIDETSIQAQSQQEPVAAEHDAQIIRELEAMAKDSSQGFWPSALAVAALRLIRRPPPSGAAAVAQSEHPFTYASTQATNCAGCGEYKHTPLRIDAMDGYVCLTCIDNKLGSLLGEFGYPEPEQAAQPAVAVQPEKE